MFEEFPPRWITCPFHKNQIKKATISCLKSCLAPKREQRRRYPKYICLQIRKEFINGQKWR